MKFLKVKVTMADLLAQQACPLFFLLQKRHRFSTGWTLEHEKAVYVILCSPSSPDASIASNNFFASTSPHRQGQHK